MQENIEYKIARDLMDVILYDNDIINIHNPLNEDFHIGAWIDDIASAVKLALPEIGENYFNNERCEIFAAGEYSEIQKMIEEHPILRDLDEALSNYFERMPAVFMNIEEPKYSYFINEMAARLFHKVKCFIKGVDRPLVLKGINIDDVEGTTYSFFNDLTEEWITAYSYQVRPILRTVEQMTQDECDTVFDLLKVVDGGENWIKINDALGIKFVFPNGIWIEDTAVVCNYLNSIQVDYTGLIENNLAIKASKSYNTVIAQQSLETVKQG